MRVKMKVRVSVTDRLTASVHAWSFVFQETCNPPIPSKYPRLRAGQPRPVLGLPARSTSLAQLSPRRALRRRRAGYPVARYRKGATRLSTDVILAENNYVTFCHHVQPFAFLLFKQKSAPWPARTVPADANMRPARAVLPRPPRASFINASLILSPSRRQQSGQVSKVYLSSDRGDQRHLSTSPTTTGRTTWPAHARENQLPRTAASCYGSCSSTCGMFMEEGGGRVTG